MKTITIKLRINAENIIKVTAITVVLTVVLYNVIVNGFQPS